MIPKIIKGTKFEPGANELLREIFEVGLKTEVNVFTKKTGPKKTTFELYCDECKMHFKSTIKTTVVQFNY